MGIKDLYAVIKQHAPEALTPVSPEDFRDHVVAVDASLCIYQWHVIGHSHGIKNSKGKFINHLQGALHRTVSLISAGITPVYVFDGPPPIAKAAALARRRDRHEAKPHMKIPRDIYAEVATLLNYMGVPVVMAPSEAEAQAAYMCANGAVDAVATEDMDAIVFGAPVMVRGLGVTKSAMKIDTKIVLDRLGLTHEQFVDFCILLGCDYTRTIPGIGRARALRLIKKYGSIDAILSGESITPPTDFNYIEAREELVRPRVTAVPQPRLRRYSPGDIDRLRTFLVDVHGLEPRRIQKSLRALAQIPLGTA